MKAATALAATWIATCSLAFTAQAAPPEGKGPGNSAHSPGQGGNAGKGGPRASGHPGKGNPGKGNSSPGNAGKRGPDVHDHPDKGPRAGRGGSAMRAHESGRRVDDRGRYYDYFDDHRDRRGHLRSDGGFGDLVFAGISAALAREYALGYGLKGYSTLPPGWRIS